ncbi:hypothetical protein BDV19DRAFT_142408 [Aspergillus venezuelensis]
MKSPLTHIVSLCSCVIARSTQTLLFYFVPYLVPTSESSESAISRMGPGPRPAQVSTVDPSLHHWRPPPIYVI